MLALPFLIAAGGAQDVGAQPMPSGEVVQAWHVTISPSWFDPATAPPQITPFGLLYALPDALVRLPGQKMGASLAESWTESPDGLTYEFKLRARPPPPQRPSARAARERPAPPSAVSV